MKSCDFVAVAGAGAGDAAAVVVEVFLRILKRRTNINH